MLRRYFIWRAEKRLGRSHYRIDRRHYRGVFSAGFFAHLNKSNFWQTDNDPYQKSRRRRKKVGLAVGFIVAIALAWLVVESIRAFRLF